MNKTRKITLIGMFSALAYIFTLVGHLVPISFTDFLRYDPKDAIIVIAGFSMGPVAALIISVIVAFLELVTISTTGLVGFAMNIISSASFACVAAIVYKKVKSISGAAIGLALSSIITVGLMVLWNYLVTPVYMGIPREAIVDMLVPIFMVFNIIKCGLNSSIVLLIYKPCVSALRLVGLIPKGKSGQGRSKISIVTIACAITLALLMIALFIILK